MARANGAKGTASIRLCEQLSDALENCVLTTCGRRFLPESRLKELVTLSKIKDELNIELPVRGFNLLKIFRRPSLNSLANGVHEKAPRVFAILAMARLVSATQELYQEGLTDGDLPLRHTKQDPNILESSVSAKEFTTFTQESYAGCAREFEEKQWRVLAPVFDTSGQHITLDEKCALPIVKLDPKVAEDGSSLVFQGEVHEDHLKGFQLEDRTDLLVAVKEIKRTKELTAAEVFERERENLDFVRNMDVHRHLIRAIATCQVLDRSYYVFFPWADGGDLKTFWETRRNGPCDNSLLLWSLKQMHGLADGLRLLHETNYRHGDLKPGNILYFSRGHPFCYGTKDARNTLVLADYGISKVHTDTTGIRMRKKMGGTSTKHTTPSYEAPEADGEQTVPRSRRYDVWSMGCILLEFAVWLLYGYDGVEGFLSSRIAKESNRNGCGSFYDTSDSEEDSNRGLNVAVKEAEEALLADTRSVGTTAITDLTLLIRNHMLQVEAGERCEAKDLWIKLGEIVTKAAQDEYLLKLGVATPDTPDVFVQKENNRKRLPSPDLEP